MDSSLYCPISKQLLIDPVIGSDGMTYSCSALKERYTGGDYIIVLDGKKITNEFIEDKVTEAKVKKFLKENPDFIIPISEVSKKKFIEAIESFNKKELELAINIEPLLLLEKLFGEKTVFQHLAQESGKPKCIFSTAPPNTIQSYLHLLKIAKVKWGASPKWYNLFESHIASKGRASAIIRVVQEGDILDVNDNNFSDNNTLLHLAAKYGQKRLVKRLILKCDADADCKNKDNKKAKDVASIVSGISIPRLIKECTHKKIHEKLFKSKDDELNKKIERLEDKNKALRNDLTKAEKSAENLKNELNKVQQYAENLQFKLNESEKCIIKLMSELSKIQKGHNNFVKLADRKGFFSGQLLQPGIQRLSSENGFKDFMDCFCKQN